MTESRTLHPKPWLVAVSTSSALLFVALAAFLLRAQGWGLLSGSALAVAILGFVALAQLATTRILLTPEALELRSLGRRRRYAHSEVAKVTWEAGSGVALKLHSGSWVKLPELGFNSQSLANTLRAWLRQPAD